MFEKQIKKPLANSVDAEEIKKFGALADEWWNPEGSFKPLHKLNPTRLQFIRDQICERFDRNLNDLKPFNGIRIADIGCGGGLLTEPMARLGADVTGLDASEKNIFAARNHADRMGLRIDYRYSTVEAAAAAGETYDVVLNMGGCRACSRCRRIPARKQRPRSVRWLHVRRNLEPNCKVVRFCHRRR